MLLQSGYSRQSEAGADEFAYQNMRDTNRNTFHFANFMRKLGGGSESERHTATVTEEDTHSILDCFSSHPGTRSRIKRALALSISPEVGELLEQSSEPDNSVFSRLGRDI